MSRSIKSKKRFFQILSVVVLLLIGIVSFVIAQKIGEQSLDLRSKAYVNPLPMPTPPSGNIWVVFTNLQDCTNIYKGCFNPANNACIPLNYEDYAGNCCVAKKSLTGKYLYSVIKPDGCDGRGINCKDAGAEITYPGATKRLLPKNTHPGDCIVPSRIVIHSSDGWNGVLGTYNTLAENLDSCMFAIDDLSIWQMLRTYDIKVEQPKCSGGTTNKINIDLELTGKNFNTTPPPESTIASAVNVVCWLMSKYKIPISNVVGHYQIWEGKSDPGDKFLNETLLPRIRTKCG